MVALVLATVILISIKLEMPMFGKMLGYVATPLEVMIALPQIIANFSTKSVRGLSFTMIGCWLVNDTAKTIYFIFEVLLFPLRVSPCPSSSLDLSRSFPT